MKSKKENNNTLPLEKEKLSNKLPFNFLFKNPCKDLKMTLLMKNKDKSDIRKYKVEVTVFPKQVKATLEFKIPIRNSTI